MLADHPLTRAGVRTLGLLVTAVVPVASSYFCYMIAYKESPFDTLITHLPIVIQLLQSNASALVSSLDDSSLPFGSLLAPAGSPLSSSKSNLLSATAAGSAMPQSLMTLSPLMNMLVAILRYLDSHGYRDSQRIPGYQYLSAFQPLRPYLNPCFAFISSHHTLAVVLALVHFWMAAELGFYVLFWARLGRLQKVDRVVKGEGSKARRRELFQRCLETVGEGDGIKRWIELWFDTGRTKQRARFEDIGRLNMIQWLAWAFWAAPIEELVRSPSALQELEQMIDTTEQVNKVKFTDGFRPDVECIRLCLDPVLASHRPLIYYVFVWLANTFATIVFRVIGFTRYKGAPKVPGYRTKAAAFSNPRRAPDLAYWYRSPPRPDNEVPLVFIHGIGIGLVQYVHLIIALASISRPLIVIEVPYVSSQLFQTDCMTPDETYFAIKRILKAHHHPKATFMGHSLGTMLCAAVCRASSATSPDSIVAGLVLVDPICFLTHYSIAHNFAYRIPATASQLVIDLFAAREIGTSWYIMRRFCWNQCVMFPIAWTRRNQKPMLYQGQLSPVLPEKTRVFLSRNDNLLDMTKVQEYLIAQVGLTEGQETSELVVMEGLDHAQLLLRPDWLARIVEAARSS